MRKMVSADQSWPRNSAEPSLPNTAATIASAPRRIRSKPATNMEGGYRRARSPGEQHVEQAHGAGLVERAVLVAALGGLDARRAAVVAGARRDGLAGRGQPLARCPEPTLGESGAPGVAVVDEDGESTGVSVQDRRDAPDVPPVAGREEREQTDRAVLGGVRGAGQVDPAPGQTALDQHVVGD